MQVLETRRQQVRAQLTTSAVPQTAGAGAHRDSSQVHGLERVVCLHWRAGAGAGTPVWWGDAATAAAHETVHGGQRLPDVQAGEGVPTAGLRLTPLRMDPQPWLRARLRQPHRGQGRPLPPHAATKAADSRRAQVVLQTAWTSAACVCVVAGGGCSCLPAQPRHPAQGHQAGELPAGQACRPLCQQEQTRQGECKPRQAQHVSCGMCRHRFSWVGRRSAVTRFTAATHTAHAVASRHVCTSSC